MRDVRFHPALIITLFLAACMGTQAPAPVTSYGLGQGAGTTGIHTVSAGETLWLISKRHVHSATGRIVVILCLYFSIILELLGMIIIGFVTAFVRSATKRVDQV